ncbi:MAG: GntR family transcriptional regulator [Rhizobiaceae bacterium]
MREKKSRGSGTRSVYETLREEILNLRLQPGSPLDEVGLAERFSMSRTPVREALVRLAADGLVTTLPNRNTIVAVIDFTGLPAYFEALTLMYRVTTRGAARRNDPAKLDKIRACQAIFSQAVAARDALRMIEANRDFHVAIAELCGNSYYTALFARLLDEGRRILRLYYSTFADQLPRQYVDEHEDMIAAISAGDTEACDRIATGHAAQIVRQIQGYLSRDMQPEFVLTDS